MIEITEKEKQEHEDRLWTVMARSSCFLRDRIRGQKQEDETRAVVPDGQFYVRDESGEWEVM